MENLEQYQHKREREINWSAAEKELLRECVNNHLSIVESKCNDTSNINKKKNAWKEIKDSMASAGFYRDVPKLKSQWVRMKMSARKAITNVKRASVATGNSVVIPELTAEDELVQSMILHELVEDDILIDSNSVKKFEYNVEQLDCDILEVQSSNEENNSTTPPERKSNTKKIKTGDFSGNLKRLRSLPKTPSKCDIISERQRQIEKESLYSEEIHHLQKQKLMDEVAQQEELHSLKLKQLQMQTEQEKETHALYIELLHKKLSILK